MLVVFLFADWQEIRAAQFAIQVATSLRPEAADGDIRIAAPCGRFFWSKYTQPWSNDAPCALLIVVAYP